MASTIRLDIVSAERELFSGECEMVVAAGVMGELGIMPRHTPLVTQLKPGEVRATLPGGEEQSFYVSGGMLEIQPHVVTVLSDIGQRAEDLDEAAALAGPGAGRAHARGSGRGHRRSTREGGARPGRGPAPGHPPAAQAALSRSRRPVERTDSLADAHRRFVGRGVSAAKPVRRRTVGTAARFHRHDAPIRLSHPKDGHARRPFRGLGGDFLHESSMRYRLLARISHQVTAAGADLTADAPGTPMPWCTTDVRGQSKNSERRVT